MKRTKSPSIRWYVAVATAAAGSPSCHTISAKELLRLLRGDIAAIFVGIWCARISYLPWPVEIPQVDPIKTGINVELVSIVCARLAESVT